MAAAAMAAAYLAHRERHAVGVPHLAWDGRLTQRTRAHLRGGATVDRARTNARISDPCLSRRVPPSPRPSARSRRLDGGTGASQLRELERMGIQALDAR